MKSTILTIAIFLAFLASAIQATDVAVRTTFGTAGSCSDDEWEALGLEGGNRRKLSERKLGWCSWGWCHYNCAGMFPGTCKLIWPWCDCWRRRSLDTGRKLDFESGCNAKKSEIEDDIDFGYDNVTSSCQTHVDTRQHKCFAMHESPNNNDDEIQRFKLWNADSNPGTVVADNLVDYESFCENGFSFSIEAIAGNQVSSVTFELYLQDDNYVHTENTAPFTLFANQGNNVNGQIYEAGIYDLLATPNGNPEKAVALRFEIRDSSDPACISNSPSAGSVPWIEDFNLSNGAQSDSGPTAWTATPGTGMSFAVQNSAGQNGALVLNNGDSDEGVLTTGAIDISGSPVDVSLDLYSVGTLEEHQDYVRLYKRVDDGPEELIGERRGNIAQGTSIGGTSITGSTLVLIIRALVSTSSEYYYMEKLRVEDCVPPSGGSVPWIEDFNLSNGAQSDPGPTAWTATPGTGMSFAVQNSAGQNGALVLNNGDSDEGVLTTGAIAISGSPVDVSLDLYSVGTLEEHQDYVRLYKRVDDGPEELIGERRGNIAQGTSIGGTSITGSTLVLIIRALVSTSGEYYYMETLRVVPT